MMFFRYLMQLILIITIISSPNLFAIEIAEWEFSSIAEDQIRFDDKINNLTAETIAVGKRSTSLISEDDSSILILNSSNADADNSLLIVEDNDVLTGHQKDGCGYGSLTIEVEFMPKAIKQCQLVRKTDGTTNIGYQLWMTKDGKLGFSVGVGEGQYHRVISKRKVQIGKWHKVLATWDGRYQFYNMQLHLDGYIAWGGAAPTLKLSNTTGPLAIGGLYRDKGNYGQFFSGAIKSVAISYDRPRIFNITGKCDPVEIKQTGEHLKKQKGFIRSEFVYDISPTPECHASTIVDLGDGKLAAAWFGGTHEGHTDVAIWFSKYNGNHWSKPVALVRSPRYNQVAHITVFNPLLFKHSNGTLMLFYKDGWVEEMESRLVTSRDDGESWSEIQYFDPPLHGPSKNKPIELPDGSILCPAGGDKMEISSDMGKTWETVKIKNPQKYFGVIQPTVLIHEDMKLQAMFRTREGHIAQSFSNNLGKSWTDLELINMPNNNSGFDAVTLKDGRHLLVYNHAGIPEGKWGGSRTPLNVAVSDEGLNWKAALVLEDEPGEYSYPSVIQSDDGMVHIIYTWHRMRIKWAVIDPSKLQLRDIGDGKWPEPAMIE